MKRIRHFTKSSRRTFLKSSAGAVAALAGGRPLRAGRQPSNPDLRVDNLILIISDTLRRDALGCYGGNWVKTPHLDQFAREAVIFDNAFVSSFPTVPLRNDILTGRFTSTYKGWSPLGQDEVTLQETLTNASILTSLVADTPHPYAPAYNFQRDFSVWDVVRGQEVDRYRSAPRQVTLPCSPEKMREPDSTVVQYLRNVAHRHGEEDYFVAQTMTRAARWLEENHDDRRFFLLVDTFDPHEPWDPPQYYVDRYDPNYEGERVIYPRYDLWRTFLTERELQHCRALYAGEASLVDRWVGFLLDQIAALGLLENTAIVFASDHGFYIGEHGYTGKALVRGDSYHNLPLYAEVARVPMLIYFPGCRGGWRAQALAQPVNFMPTILELMGVARPAGLRSQSLVPLLDGRSQKVDEVVVAAPSLLEDPGAPPSPASRCSVTDGEWMLIVGPQLAAVPQALKTAAVDSLIRRVRELQGEITPELYHLKNDPGCEKNLIRESPAVATRLHAALREFLARWDYPPERREYFRRWEISAG